MLDDVRDHDPHPTAEEEGWIAFHEVATIARAMLLAVIALAIGWGASELLDDSPRQGQGYVAISPR